MRLLLGDKSCLVHKDLIFEPEHDKTNKMACAPSEDLDQPRQPPSLISAFAVVANDPKFLHADSEVSDQTRRIRRLIWVFGGRTCHFFGFAMVPLICTSDMFPRAIDFCQFNNQSFSK